MQMIKFFHYTLAFVLEICMLVAMGKWAYSFGEETWSKYALLVLIVGIAIALWAYFAAPKSPNRLNLKYRIIFKFILFAVTVWMLYDLGLDQYAWIFGLAALLSLCMEVYFKKP